MPYDMTATNKYVKTKKGVIKTIYCSQLSSSRDRNHPKPEYSNKEFFDWCIGQDIFHSLYNNWVKSGYIRMEKPSVDRINVTKHYTFDNIQLMTYRENHRKCVLYEMNHIKKRAILDQYSLDGKFIGRWVGVNETAKCIERSSTALLAAMNGKTKTCAGYRWKRISKKRRYGINNGH